MGMFGAVDVGMDMSWWDYGMLALYAANSRLLTEGSEDAALMRQFFGIADGKRISADCCLRADTEGAATGVEVDATSVVSATNARSGKITASVIANVNCSDISAEGAVLVGCSAKKITAAKGSIGYNLVDASCSEEGIVLAENEVRVGVFTLQADKSYFEMKSDVEKTDGGKVFTSKVHGNPLSFQEVYDLNQGTDVTACAAKAQQARAAFDQKANL